MSVDPHSKTTDTQSSDILIVGGGPTGLSAAIFCALKGLQAEVWEPKSGIIDKACGEGLMPAAIEKLQNMGVQINTSHEFLGIRYIEHGLIAEGHFPQGPGQGVRRLVLHEALMQRAKELGVRFQQRKLQNIHSEKDYIVADGQIFSYALAADGLNSPIRRNLGLDLPPKRPKRLGMRRHYAQKPWSSFVEVYWSPQAEAYVTPVSDNQVGVAILYYKDIHLSQDISQSKYDQLLQLFPDLCEKLQGEPSSILRGAGHFERRSKTKVHGRILLIGDAGGYLDPLTGEGIRLGLDTAEAAVECISHHQPQKYNRLWKIHTLKYWVLTDGLLFIRRFSILRKLIVPTMHRLPRIFSRIIGMLAG